MAKQLPPGAQGARALGLRRLLARLSGARLCYGEAVRVADRAVIPVARVQVRGGGGWGTNEQAPGSGGGGGGTLNASPVGFIELSADGARYEAIPDPDRPAKLLKAAAAAATTLVAVAAVRGALLRR